MARGRPRKIDPEKALHAAMLTFWRKGYEATSMSDLVESTGMAKPGLYATFGDKQELFKKSLENYVEFHGKPIIAKLMHSKVSAKETLREVLIVLVDSFFNASTPDGCFLANSLVKSANDEPAISNLANKIQQFRWGKFLEYFEKAKQEGNLAADNDPEILADYFSAQVITLPILHKTGADKESLHKFIETVLLIIRE